MAKKRKIRKMTVGRQSAARGKKPLDVRGQIQVGLALHQAGKSREAEGVYRQVLKQDPLNCDANHLLGAVALQDGDYSEAERLIRLSLSTAPNNSGAHNNLGTVLKELGRDAEAMAEYELAVALDPGNAVVYNNIGGILRGQERYVEAVTSFKRALAIRPDYGDALYNLAVVTEKLGEHQRAMDLFQEAICKNPSDAEAYYNLGESAQHTGDIEQAISYYNEAIKLVPLHKKANQNLLFSINYHPYLAAKDIFAVYRSWQTRVVQPEVAPAKPTYPNTCTERRLRVGYVSPDFCNHVVRYFIEPVLENHNHETCEVYAYAELEKVDHVTLRVKRLVDHWRETKELSDDELADLIRADKIDILVDLAGHSRGNRLMVFARKPAPVQVSWVIGYGYTTGLTAIDYFLADKYLVPEGYGVLFSEQVHRLPRHGYCYRPPYDAPAVVSAPALTNGHITFGSLSRTIRLNERVVSLWAKILHNVPGSLLMLNNQPFAEEETQQLFKERFAQHGIGEERLIFAYSQPHWQAYQQIDITLDPFPHNGGTSTLESLWMGAPVITLADRPSVGRIGATCLHAVGMSAWIAATESEYLEIAVAAAHDVARLDEIRHGLRQCLQDSPLMDEAGFTRELEDAYRAMWQGWCGKCGNGKKNAGIVKIGQGASLD